jgi:RHH-type transcriptional regulator, proline utilization regulon repressor / proline dehydrogenase / delta 1-pyrroline-5-carboxylate dehydrogenase
MAFTISPPVPTDPETGVTVFRNEPERDYSRAAAREAMAAALAAERVAFGRSHPLLIDGEAIRTSDELVSINPANPAEVVGRTASATLAEAERAVQAANRAFPGWRDTPAGERAALLFRVAELIRQQRDRLAALEVFEVGKPWRESDADVTETIDYLEYYGREMLRLDRPRRMGPVPGEINEYFYQPRGVCVVIPPWNFPMAILTGMTAAALVTGNTVILKPAVQSPVIAARLVELFLEAGVPPGVLNFVPGPGVEIGEFLVGHRQVHMIAFTGSRAVGCRINAHAAVLQEGQDHLKRVLAEMGGKNAIIVDEDADLDEAVAGVAASAFGYAGQKCSACSRAIVLDPIHDAFLARLIETARSLRVGPPEDPGSYLGPVIDATAHKRVRDYIEIGRQEARLVLETDVSHLGDGYFVAPTIFADVPPRARIAQEEIFGPVLGVLRVRGFDEALAVAMDTPYALTGGVYSRSPAHLEQARREFRVGNLYLNRKCTGAIVARQPFGGFKMSGIGSKAGGPDYLLQFLEPRTVTENTVRHGFTPDDLGGPGDTPGE